MDDREPLPQLQVNFSDEHTEPPTHEQSPNADGINNHNSASLESIELEEALGYLASRKTWHFLIFLAIASFDIPFAFNLMAPVFLVGTNMPPKVPNGTADPCNLCLGNDQVTIMSSINDSYTIKDDYRVSSNQCFFKERNDFSESFKNVSWTRCTKFDEVCNEPFGKTVVTDASSLFTDIFAVLGNSLSGYVISV